VGLGSAGRCVDQEHPNGTGDSINVQAVYTDGATRYNFQSLFPQSFFMF